MATKYCPQCQTTTPHTLLQCPQCQAVLSLKDPYGLVGRTLLDRYQIEALVGLGGMGAVYCAFHTGIERRVAFKVLQPNIALADERLIDLFEREAKVAGRLTHENIVDVKDAGRVQNAAGNLAYIVMEWLDGRTLEDELQNDAQLNFAQTNEILQQMASALAEAHAKSVVHRDLKPANVMLLNRPAKQPKERQSNILVKVLDFGIGKIVNETGSAVSAVMGTPSYASPEQLQLGSKLDHRSDIYSLGVMLYRMLSGRLPFNGQTLAELVQMQLTVIPEPLSNFRPDVPPALETLIHRMLAKDPAMRPVSVQEIATLFAAALHSAHLNESASLSWPESTPALSPFASPAAPHSPQKTGQKIEQQTDQRTELRPDAPTPRRFEIAVPNSPTPKPAISDGAPPRLPLVIALGFIALLVVGGGFALYRFAFNAGAAQPATNIPNTVVAETKPASAGNTVEPNSPAAHQSNATQTQVNAAPKTKTEVKTSPTPLTAKTETTAPTQPAPSAARSELPLATSPAVQNEANASGETRRWPVADLLFSSAVKQYEAGNYQAALDLCNQTLAVRPMHRGARQLRQKLNSDMKNSPGRP